MLESPHVIAGALIASKIANPLLAIPLSLASHFVLDMVPHWNPHINQEIKKHGKPTKASVRLISFDSAAALVMGTTLALRDYPNTGQVILTLLCCFAAVLPDVVEIPYYFFGHRHSWAEKWIKWQKSIQNDVNPVYGLATQVLIILTGLLWIFA